MMTKQTALCWLNWKRRGRTMPKWTDAQQDAIDARGGNILVSAAAGSGKTAVLIERVSKCITDRGTR